MTSTIVLKHETRDGCCNIKLEFRKNYYKMKEIIEDLKLGTTYHGQSWNEKEERKRETENVIFKTM